MSKIETRLAELGITLPAPPPAVGSYVPAIRTGSHVITSGQLPAADGALACTGKVGEEVTIEEAAQGARIACLNALAQIKATINDLDHIKQIVRVEGFVQSADNFTDQAKVLNGASDLLVDIFGEAGRHTRFAVGVNVLPLNASVELAVWAEV